MNLSVAEIDDHALLGRVLDFYTDTLKQTPEALAFLEAKANRTLDSLLPLRNSKARAAIRGQLEGIGLYRSSGHEHFNGSPIFGEHGDILQVHGRKIRDDLRPYALTDIFLPATILASPRRTLTRSLA